MSYSLETFYDEHLKNKIKEMTENHTEDHLKGENDNSEAEEFVQALKDAFAYGDKFKGLFIKAIIDPYSEMSNDELIRELLTQCLPIALRKIEYASESDNLINIDYQKIVKEESE